MRHEINDCNKHVQASKCCSEHRTHTDVQRALPLWYVLQISGTTGEGAQRPPLFWIKKMQKGEKPGGQLIT